jgi:hypothetical protein
MYVCTEFVLGLGFGMFFLSQKANPRYLDKVLAMCMFLFWGNCVQVRFVQVSCALSKYWDHVYACHL